MLCTGTFRPVLLMKTPLFVYLRYAEYIRMFALTAAFRIMLYTGDMRSGMFLGRRTWPADGVPGLALLVHLCQQLCTVCMADR